MAISSLQLIEDNTSLEMNNWKVDCLLKRVLITHWLANNEDI